MTAPEPGDSLPPEVAPGRDDQVGRLVVAVRALLASLPSQPEELRVRAGEVTVELTWPRPVSVPQHAGPPVRTAADTPVNGHRADDHVPGASKYICAPSVGTFHRAPSPGTTPFVAEGDILRPDQQVAIVEAMKLMLPVKAEYACRAQKILKRDGEPVEFGERLIQVVRVDAG